MDDKQLQKGLQLRVGMTSISELSNCLYDLLEVEPAYAKARAADAVAAFTTLLGRHSNADTQAIETAETILTIALTNAATSASAKLVACNPDEQIIDYEESPFNSQSLE